MSATPPQDAGGGFTLRRWLPATAERVFAAFVEPSRLEQLFVVPAITRRPIGCGSMPVRAGGWPWS